MTKKSLGYVQLEWTCPNCSVKNPGLQKLCSGCGSAQPAGVEFEQAAQEEMIEDKATLEKAQAGPDIHCAYCGTRNPAGVESCSRCGGDLTQATARQSGKVLGAHRDKAAEPVSCPSCGSPNDPQAQRCTQCGAALARPEAPPQRAPAEPKGRSRLPLIIGAALVLICLCVAAFAILSNKTEDVVGQVQAVEWTRSIGVKALQPVTYSDWQDDIPAGAQLGACSEKYHHSQPDPAADAHEVCGTPYTVDTGSGAGEVVQDCEYEVYAQWCEYLVEEWREITTFEISGNDLYPAWPEVNLLSGEREGERQEAYAVILTADGERYTYEPQTETEFVQFEPNSEWVLAVNSFGGLVSVAPAE